MHSSLLKMINENGIYEVGFSKVDSPFEGLSNAITIVVPLSNAVVNQIDKAPTKTYFHHYRTVNAFIDNLLEKIVLHIINLGFDAAAVPASQSVTGFEGVFSHKEAAVRAGLGYIGKSCLFISDKFGPRVRLGTVFTDMPLPVRECAVESKCGECNLCVKACPAFAISGREYKVGMKREDFFDARACSEYMKKQFQDIGRGAVCGICMKHCPKGLTRR